MFKVSSNLFLVHRCIQTVNYQEIYNDALKDRAMEMEWQDGSIHKHLPTFSISKATKRIQNSKRRDMPRS